MSRSLLSSTQETRFLARVTKMDDGCWLWTGTVVKAGYGVIDVSSDGAKRQYRVHRAAYLNWVGEIPDGYVIDHRCHGDALAAGKCPGGPSCIHRRCVNPGHLEVVTQQVNVVRGARVVGKTHCPQGHEYTPENTGRSPNGARRCKRCGREKARASMINRLGRGLAAYVGDRTHCPQGHPYDAENTYMAPDGSRKCRECCRERVRRRRARGLR